MLEDLKSGDATPGTKFKLEKQLIKLIKGQKSTIHLMASKRPQSDEDLTFDYTTFQQYMDAIGGHQHSEGELDEDDYVKKITQIVDYLANPSIIKKNLDVTIDLTNEFYHMSKPENFHLFSKI